MSEDDARTALEIRTAHDDDPKLGSEDIDYLLTFAKRADQEGRPPHDDDWTPTWDLDSAAAEGWRIKAGRAAKMFDFAEDAQRFSVSRIHAQCITQERVYRRRIMQSIEMQSSGDSGATQC